MPYVMAQQDDLYNSVSGLGEIEERVISKGSTINFPDNTLLFTGTQPSVSFYFAEKASGKISTDAVVGKDGKLLNIVEVVPMASYMAKFAGDRYERLPAGTKVLLPKGTQFPIAALTGTVTGQTTPTTTTTTQQRQPVSVSASGPGAPRSTSAVVKVVQGKIGAGVDGTYGPETHRKLKGWAAGKGFDASVLDKQGPQTLTIFYPGLGLTSPAELDKLQEAWRACARCRSEAMATTRPETTLPEATEEAPPPSPEDMWGGKVQEAGFTEWLKNYWWIFAAVAVVGVGGYLIWKRRSGSDDVYERPTLPVPERATLPMPGVPQEG